MAGPCALGGSVSTVNVNMPDVSVRGSDMHDIQVHRYVSMYMYRALQYV